MCFAILLCAAHHDTPLTKALCAASTHRYHPATISFAMRLLQKVGKSFYEKEVRNVLMLPSARHLQTKIGEIDTAGDGFNTELTQHYADLAAQLKFNNWERSGCISTDAMTVRDGLSWNAHRGEIGGFDTHGTDAAVILGEFRAASKRLASPEQASASAASLSDMRARHYTVYIFTTFGPYVTASGERRAMQWVVSRHAMAQMMPSLIAADLTTVVTCLEVAGFYVKCVSLDGATENEACTKKLCTLSLRDLLDTAAQAQLQLPDADLDFPIAWRHPLTGDPIFFVADMGHVVKRIVNALETSSNPSSKRELRYVVDAPDAPQRGGVPKTVCMGLGMLDAVHKESAVPDASSAVGGELSLRICRTLSLAHFRKDAHSRMSVPLAMQVLSRTMLALIDDYLERSGCASLAREFTGMRELITRVNRLVDICNCRGADADPPAYAINSRNHPIIGELASTMSFFTKWREAIDSCPDFSTQQARENAKLSVATHTGVQRLILGLIGTALCHLPENHSWYALNPRRVQSDPCEHLFSMIRFAATGGNPTMQGAFQSTAIHGAAKLVRRRLKAAKPDCEVQTGVALQLPAFLDVGGNKSYQAPAHGPDA